MAPFREKLEGHLMPLLIHILGMEQFAKLVISQGLKWVSKERADWVVRLIAQQDRNLMISAWRETMAFDSRLRLADIKCPTLVIAGADDEAVPIHHAEMLHAGISGSQLVIVNGADHALIWGRPDELLLAVDKFLEGRTDMVSIR